uniref:Uncharacterized protein n=1 Tax=Gasterosteus aculeatus TaxID=69293 RepID=G3Q8P9_GASAC
GFLVLKEPSDQRDLGRSEGSSSSRNHQTSGTSAGLTVPRPQGTHETSLKSEYKLHIKSKGQKPEGGFRSDGEERAPRQRKTKICTGETCQSNVRTVKGIQRGRSCVWDVAKLVS